MKDHLIREGRLTKVDLLELLNKFIDLVKKEPNVIEMEDPVTVVGDIHGQFYDLPKIFEVGGDPKDNKYLFLGDYVDRGMFSIEVVAYLYSLKVGLPLIYLFY